MTTSLPGSPRAFHDNDTKSISCLNTWQQIFSPDKQWHSNDDCSTLTKLRLSNVICMGPPMQSCQWRRPCLKIFQDKWCLAQWQIDNVCSERLIVAPMVRAGKGWVANYCLIIAWWIIMIMMMHAWTVHAVWLKMNEPPYQAHTVS